MPPDLTPPWVSSKARAFRVPMRGGTNIPSSVPNPLQAQAPHYEGGGKMVLQFLRGTLSRARLLLGQGRQYPSGWSTAASHLRGSPCLQIKKIKKNQIKINIMLIWCIYLPWYSGRYSEEVLNLVLIFFFFWFLSFVFCEPYYVNVGYVFI